MGKLVTILSEVSKVESFGLTQEQHDLAVRMIDEVRMIVKNENGGNYYLEDVDPDRLDCFIENAQEDNDKEYEEFLVNAKSHGADVYAFTDHLGDFSQELGDVAVY